MQGCIQSASNFETFRTKIHLCIPRSEFMAFITALSSFLKQLLVQILIHGSCCTSQNQVSQHQLQGLRELVAAGWQPYLLSSLFWHVSKNPRSVLSSLLFFIMNLSFFPCFQAKTNFNWYYSSSSFSIFHVFQNLLDKIYETVCTIIL